LHTRGEPLYKSAWVEIQKGEGVRSGILICFLRHQTYIQPYNFRGYSPIQAHVLGSFALLPHAVFKLRSNTTWDPNRITRHESQHPISRPHSVEDYGLEGERLAEFFGAAL